MEIQLLREYEEDGFKVQEYTRDGETVSHIVKTTIQVLVEPVIPTQVPTLEDKINYLYYKGVGVI